MKKLFYDYIIFHLLIGVIIAAYILVYPLMIIDGFAKTRMHEGVLALILKVSK